MGKRTRRKVSKIKAFRILRNSPDRFLLKTTKNKLVSPGIKNLAKKVLKEREAEKRKLKKLLSKDRAIQRHKRISKLF